MRKRNKQASTKKETPRDTKWSKEKHPHARRANTKRGKHENLNETVHSLRSSLLSPGFPRPSRSTFVSFCLGEKRAKGKSGRTPCRRCLSRCLRSSFRCGVVPASRLSRTLKVFFRYPLPPSPSLALTSSSDSRSTPLLPSSSLPEKL